MAYANQNTTIIIGLAVYALKERDTRNTTMKMINLHWNNRSMVVIQFNKYSL